MTWHPWKGGDRPVHPEAMCEFRYRNGQSSSEPRRAGTFLWRHRGWDFDIIGYRVVSVPDEVRG